jgi:hypothetical protein
MVRGIGGCAAMSLIAHADEGIGVDCSVSEQDGTCAEVIGWPVASLW